VIIELHLNDEEINRVSGQLAGPFTLTDFKQYPQWFVANADSIEVRGSFGKYSEAK
jgi:hypothetical protein